MMRIAQQ